MTDITPELLKKIKEQFERELKNNKRIKKLLEKLEKGNATYIEANDYSKEIGDILAKALDDNLSSEVLPDGKMYYNIADRVFNETMRNNYYIISDYSVETQTELNLKAGMNINGLRPELNQDRIDGIVNKVSEEDVFDNIKYMIGEPVRNFSQSIVDDTIKTNVEAHYKLGLSPKIIRNTKGDCCKWCSDLAGIYDYPDNVPEDVYRRHQYCRCDVDYHPGDGKVQNVHSKVWTDSKGRIINKEDI